MLQDSAERGGTNFSFADVFVTVDAATSGILESFT